MKNRIVIRLAETVALPKDLSILSRDKLIGEWNWGEFRKRFPQSSLSPRVVNSRGAIEVATEEARIALDRLERTFNLQLGEAYDGEEMSRIIGSVPSIESFYFEPETSFPTGTVDPRDDPYFTHQGYISTPPFGIGADYAWNFAGGQAEGQHFVDIEHGWTLDHEDFSGLNINLIHGDNDPLGYRHGTSVLGEIFARDNDRGCVGICPASSISVAVASVKGRNNSVPRAIIAAANYLPKGGVLLLELQWRNWGSYPLMILEVADDVFDAIVIAVSKGIIVIEAAGNGGNDLDQVSIGGKFILNPQNKTDFRDSGAIIVGAGSSTVPATRLYFSNHGQRVNCFGWGHNVTTTTSDSNGSKTDYTLFFNGTSSASPIIAGAALVVQGIHENRTGRRLTPNQMRLLLSNPDLGTRSHNPAVDRIGVLPDLRKILGTLDVFTDVYIRDHVADDGSSHTMSSQSPDIILRHRKVADPEASFGKSSGRLNRMDLSQDVRRGSTNYLYGRGFHRSGSLSQENVLDFYWAKGSTLPLPDSWTHIGSVPLRDFGAGDSPVVSEALEWSRNIPAPGHYCFVAVLRSKTDLVVDLTKISRISDWVAFVRGNNNVAWRNFNVLDSRPRPTEPYPRTLEFIARNTDDLDPMTLQVYCDLPPNPYGSVYMEVPKYFWDFVDRGKVTGDGTPIKVQLDPRGMNEILFDRPIPRQTPVKIIYDIDLEHLNRDYGIYARQLYRGLEVGRINWDLRFNWEREQDDL